MPASLVSPEKVEIIARLSIYKILMDLKDSNMKLWLIYLFLIKVICASPTPANITGPTPIVLWHGMGDTCCMPFSLGAFKHFLEKNIPNVYVHSLQIGNSTIEDFESGYFMRPNKQVAYACNKLKKDSNLSNGFNVIGFSQGCQFLRALVQRCGHQLPPIKNMISFGGQHQGIYGLPHCGALQHESCDYIRKLLNVAAYTKWLQESLVQATYWHDPLHEKTYRNYSQFLSDINNEVNVNQKYIDNLNKLEKFVLVKFNNDSIVQPRETEWFGYYAPGQSRKLITLQESRIYIQDRLGLKKMDQAGKLVFLSVDGDHLQFSAEWTIENIIKPYLI